MKLTQVFATIVTVSDSFHKETTSVPICILSAMDKFWAHAILDVLPVFARIPKRKSDKTEKKKKKKRSAGNQNAQSSALQADLYLLSHRGELL